MSIVIKSQSFNPYIMFIENINIVTKLNRLTHIFNNKFLAIELQGALFSNHGVNMSSIFSQNLALANPKTHIIS